MGVELAKNSVDLGIVTTNGEPMLAFYQEVLGLTKVAEMKMPGGGGLMHQLLCGESMIKVIVVDEAPASAPPGGIQGATGYRYWTITVTNMAEMLTACGEAGHTIVMPETEIREGIKISIVADPDGNWVEFLSLG